MISPRPLHACSITYLSFKRDGGEKGCQSLSCPNETSAATVARPLGGASLREQRVRVEPLTVGKADRGAPFGWLACARKCRQRDAGQTVRRHKCKTNARRTGVRGGGTSFAGGLAKFMRP